MCSSRVSLTSGARKGWVFNAMPRPLYALQKKPDIPFIGAQMDHSVCVASEENFAPTESYLWTLQPCSESLY
jgi:hypothetical protein